MLAENRGDAPPPRPDPRSGAHTVAAVIANGASPFELAVACEVFGLERPEFGVPWYRFLVCAAEPTPIRTSVGFTLDTPHGLAALAGADTIVLPSWRVGEEPPCPLLDAVLAAYRRGARLATICSGAFVLAAAGLLDDRPATTHWRYSAQLTARYPKIRVDPNVLYVDDGQILTSAGTAAGIDLCLHMVRLDYGAEVANQVARRMVVPPHRDGGQAQYVDAPVRPAPAADPLGDTLAWAMAHLDRPLAVGELARRAAMSERSFLRRFRAATGTTPHRWLLDQRLLLARRLLETTDSPVERVATLSGLGSAATLRLHFARRLSTSPLAYRRLFARDGASSRPRHDWRSSPRGVMD